MAEPPPLRILILSDIHFGSWSHYLMDRNPALRWPDQWVNGLLHELRVVKATSEASPPYDAIVLNGDQTSNCERGGFIAAKLLIDELVGLGYCKNKDRKRILLLPGNHEALWPPEGAPLLSQSQRIEMFRQQYGECLGCKHATEDHAGVLLFPGQNVALLGLDSCRIEGSLNPGIGYIGSDQMEDMIRAIEAAERADGCNYRRIAFVHHHILLPGSLDLNLISLPGEARRFSYLADATRMLEALDVFKIDFLFHGHFHTAELNLAWNRSRESGRIVSVGSIAGSVKRCTGETRHFLVLELWESRMRVHDYRSIKDGAWSKREEEFALPPRRPMQSGPEVEEKRGEDVRRAVRDLQTYGQWDRAARFFKSDFATLAEVKSNLERSPSLAKQADRFEAAWAKLLEKIKQSPDESLAEYTRALQDENRRPTLEQYLMEELRRTVRDPAR